MIGIVPLACPLAPVFHDIGAERQAASVDGRAPLNAQRFIERRERRRQRRGGHSRLRRGLRNLGPGACARFVFGAHAHLIGLAFGERFHARAAARVAMRKRGPVACAACPPSDIIAAERQPANVARRVPCQSERSGGGAEVEVHGRSLRRALQRGDRKIARRPGPFARRALGINRAGAKLIGKADARAALNEALHRLNASGRQGEAHGFAPIGCTTQTIFHLIAYRRPPAPALALRRADLQMHANAPNLRFEQEIGGRFNRRTLRHARHRVGECAFAELIGCAHLHLIGAPVHKRGNGRGGRRVGRLIAAVIVERSPCAIGRSAGEPVLHIIIRNRAAAIRRLAPAHLQCAACARRQLHRGLGGARQRRRAHRRGLAAAQRIGCHQHHGDRHAIGEIVQRCAGRIGGKSDGIFAAVLRRPFQRQRGERAPPVIGRGPFDGQHAVACGQLHRA